MTYKTYTTKTENLIPPHGGYRNLKSYQMAEIIYDLTVIFTKKYIPFGSRTKDQMDQAGRSGKQNIAEASVDSGTSKKIELKLIGIARGSLEELLQDCEDFLRQHNLPIWKKDDPRSQTVRQLAYKSNKTYTTYETYMSNPEIAANCLICLIHQANFLLDRQLNTLQKEFLEKGGFTEKLYSARSAYRADKTNGSY
jgi:restriction system protein